MENRLDLAHVNLRRVVSLKRRYRDNRPVEDLVAHYNVETALADRLRSATSEQRRRLYREVYDEAYRTIPNHPTRRDDPGARARHVAGLLALLRPYLRPDADFVEIGPGHGCALSLEVCRHVRHVTAIDVSDEISRVESRPPNFEHVIYDGIDIGRPPESADVVFSNQVLEHLHPDDAVQQVGQIHRALRPGGVFLFTVPNRLSGPGDISKYFDTHAATGFHLREYTHWELRRILKAAGFRRVGAIVGMNETYFRFPLLALESLERSLDALPRPVNGAIARRRPFSTVLRIKMVAFK